MSTSRRPKEDQNFWNFLFSLFFLAVLAAAVQTIYLVRGGFPASVPLLDILLMSLAAFRITRLIVYDKIARWFRELFAARREFTEDGVTYVEIIPAERGIRHTLYDLLQCPWCIGFWGALTVSFAYFVFPWAYLVILFLAVAGLGSFVQVAANAVGWHAENLKLEAKERDRDLRL